jgi:hypothetical protein
MIIEAISKKVDHPIRFAGCRFSALFRRPVQKGRMSDFIFSGQTGNWLKLEHLTF